MKIKHIIVLTFLLNSIALKIFSQTSSNKDSTKSQYNFMQAPIYFRASPFSIYTGAGKTKDRIAQYFEIGKSFSVIDIGVAVGRNSLRPDTTLFVEGKVTMDVANFGIFANEMTLGAGKLFDTRGSLMLELNYSIFAQFFPHLGFGLTTGYYDFSNEKFGSSQTYYGIFLRYGTQRTDSGGLVGIGRAHRRLNTKHHVHGR